MFVRIQRFWDCQSGVASIEFAVIGSLLLVLFAGGFDLVYMVNAKRDADRASVLIAHAMATCTNSSCISDMINIYTPRQANALVRYPTAKIDLYMIQYQGGQIKTCSGSKQILTDSDVIASAKSILREDDVGSAVVLTTTYTSILPKMVLNYISSTGATYRKYTVDVMSNVGSVC